MDSSGRFSTGRLAESLTCEDLGCQCHQHNGRRLHCPAHDDPGVSLIITPSKVPQALPNVHCVSGCSREQLIAALAIKGLYPSQKGQAANFHLSESSIPAGRDGTQNIVVIPSMDVQPPEQIKGGQGMLDPVIPPVPALVMLSGESSAGKTVLAYNIAYHLAEGIPFGGMKPPQRFLCFKVNGRFRRSC